MDCRHNCRHVYQFSKVFVGEQTMSRSASSSALCTSPPRVAVTGKSTALPSHTCLVSDRVMPPAVPVSNPSETTPVLFSRTLVQSLSSPSSCQECLSSPATLPDDGRCDKVQCLQVPNEPVSSATDACEQLEESQVQCIAVADESIICFANFPTPVNLL